MNYLDLYLQKNNCKRYDVHKKTGVSQQLLSTHTKKNIDKYSTKVIVALADTLDKTPGQVLDELMELQRENPVYEAFTPQELLIGLKAQEDVIIIRGAYCEKIREMMKGQLSETESMGFELGSGGLINILADAINSVREHFSNEHLDKVEKDIEKKLRLYKVKHVSEDSIALSLKQLDY